MMNYRVKRCEKIGWIVLLIWSVCLWGAGAAFECKWVATRQDPSLDWWYAIVPEFSPKLTPVDAVAKGEYITLIPFFERYGKTSNAWVNISYDVDVVWPDGQTKSLIKGQLGCDGQTDQQGLLISKSVLQFAFEEHHPYGDYRLDLTAYDHINNQTNRQSLCLEQRAFALGSVKPRSDESFFLTYAQSPDPALALSSFINTTQSFFTKDSEPIWSAVWFYKTIFEENEFLMPHLMSAFYEGNIKQQKDIILMLSLLNRTDLLPKLSMELDQFRQLMAGGRAPNAYIKVTSGVQIDMLWGEFCATGRIRPVRQLITAFHLAEKVGTLDKIKTGGLDASFDEVYLAGLQEGAFQSLLLSMYENLQKSPLLFQYGAWMLKYEELDDIERYHLGLLMQVVQATKKSSAEATTDLKESVK